MYDLFASLNPLNSNISQFLFFASFIFAPIKFFDVWSKSLSVIKSISNADLIPFFKFLFSIMENTFRNCTLEISLYNQK